MRLLRHRHLLGCLAMIVFAMQGLLAFAQTHTHTATRGAPVELAARAITYGMCRPGQEKPCTPPAPQKHDDSCSVCGALALAGTGVLQAPPAIMPQRPRMDLPTPVKIAGLVDGVSHRIFQARAPPIA